MQQPTLHPTVFAAEGAIIKGDVSIAENCSIWFHAVVRADRSTIQIGAGSNIQDNSVVHVDEGNPVVIGEHVTIGHGCIIHGCKVGDNTVIGMGSILLNGAKIGKNCIIGAGTLITQEAIIPDNSLVIGRPGKVTRQVTAQEIVANIKNAKAYIAEAIEYTK